MKYLRIDFLQEKCPLSLTFLDMNSFFCSLVLIFYSFPYSQHLLQIWCFEKNNDLLFRIFFLEPHIIAFLLFVFQFHAYLQFFIHFLFLLSVICYFVFLHLPPFLVNFSSRSILVCLSIDKIQ